MNRLREVRQAEGMSAAELGRRIRVDPSVVRHVEAGRIYPYPAFRRRVARVLKRPERDLFPDNPGHKEPSAR